LPPTDFLTKLDIVDSHPEIFESGKDGDLTFTKEELEQLRVLVVGD
jgi:hypothetical protein